MTAHTWEILLCLAAIALWVIAWRMKGDFESGAFLGQIALAILGALLILAAAVLHMLASL